MRSQHLVYMFRQGVIACKLMYDLHDSTDQRGKKSSADRASIVVGGYAVSPLLAPVWTTTFGFNCRTAQYKNHASAIVTQPAA